MKQGPLPVCRTSPDLLIHFWVRERMLPRARIRGGAGRDRGVAAWSIKRRGRGSVDTFEAERTKKRIRADHGLSSDVSAPEYLT